ncbi:MAG TPA: choice-of-anchor tandem repeat GloVer-containing protein [Candidatus Cybelea sp.]|jgi:uncharacterized repeat protein (TIGR03803 family)|nr:choice-of-anchor tandem repeat GloVer-containing protein [Candidatus Cybelea sp.]
MHARSFAVFIALAVLTLSGCAGTPQSNLTPANGSLAPSVRSQKSTSSYGVLYEFTGGRDGKFPRAVLTEVDGTLYGTTAGDYTDNFGNVFAITTSGKETSLYNFAGGKDGNHSRAGLANRDGTLYGTTEDGGFGHGTVFSITVDGKEKVLHRFAGRHDGQLPIAGLLDLKDELYGTTSDYGSGGNGTVFRVTDHKNKYAYEVLNVLGGGSAGQHPVAALINVDGALYGTTAGGGVSELGTIFKVTFAGVKTLHSFGGGSDGARPYGALTEVGGILYGTTLVGGGAGCSGDGCGTVFKMKVGGSEYEVLHSFAGGGDGAHPKAGLTNVHGTLYGTTEKGGASGLGTVFTIDRTSAAEQVVHSFAGGADGSSPEAGLIEVGSRLYGTTVSGGAHGSGTVYALSGI